MIAASTAAPGEPDLVVIGGGAAGLAAAAESSDAGLRTLLIDEGTMLGGQIYKRLRKGFSAREGAGLGKDYHAGTALIDRVLAGNTEICSDAVVWDIAPDQVSFVANGRPSNSVRAKAIVLATGAYDRPVVFPGWTLPGVLSAGGAQALVKTQLMRPGRRVLMVGTGPLLLAFSAQLVRLGVNIVAVVDAAPRPTARTALELLRKARGFRSLLSEGAGYHAFLRRRRIPMLYRHLVRCAEGDTRVENAVVSAIDADWTPIAGTERSFDVDTVCVGYGFCPSNELARLVGCEHLHDEDLGGWIPVRDDCLRSASHPTVLIAGDGGGVRGSRAAVLEGRLAGLTAARDIGHSVADAEARCTRLRLRLQALERFRQALTAHYSIGPGIYQLHDSNTIVCRCEEVTAGEVNSAITLHGADLLTVKSVRRVGMGLCQGRSCSIQVASLVAASAQCSVADVGPMRPRAPVKPVPIAALAKEVSEETYDTGRQPLSEVG